MYFKNYPKRSLKSALYFKVEVISLTFENYEIEKLQKPRGEFGNLFVGNESILEILWVAAHWNHGAIAMVCRDSCTP